MEGVTFNSVIRISGGAYPGDYRVIVQNPRLSVVVLFRLPSQGSSDHPAEVPPGQCILEREELVKLFNIGAVKQLDIGPDRAVDSPSASGSMNVWVRKRVSAMKNCFDGRYIEKMFITGGGTAAIIREARAVVPASRSVLYEWWLLLCIYGFTQSSLQTSYCRSGAPGTRRHWGMGSLSAGSADEISPRKKPGRRSTDDLECFSRGEVPTPLKGWTQEQERLLKARFKLINTPRARFSKVYPKLIEEVFGATPEIGSFPNLRAAYRIIRNDLGDAALRRSRTTANHYEVNCRGLIGRSYNGAAGPGARFGIDATVGDIYLVSSVNSQWIVGRPIVYLVVDVWSTAVVGFHVCLEGPSWKTASVALFSTFAGYTEVSDAWGFKYDAGLYPEPGVCGHLVTDRGEVFSALAHKAALSIGWTHSVMPSYRPDLKGWLEVLHRIIKDRVYSFTPGAMNARRKEKELQGDKRESVLTLRQYAQIIAIEIERYNQNANRRKRLTSSMVAAGIRPSPAGLWSFGHQVGLGYIKQVERSQLIRELLPTFELNVTTAGPHVRDLLFTGERSFIRSMTEHARNMGAFAKIVHAHPSSIGRIWMPQERNQLAELFLSASANAPPEVTFDEHADVYVQRQVTIGRDSHDALLRDIQFDRRAKQVVNEATLKKEADAWRVTAADVPNIREARRQELALQSGQLLPAAENSVPALPTPTQSVDSTFDDMLGSALSRRTIGSKT